jgi:C_GCAxxG_C_C family probable redox protein
VKGDDAACLARSRFLDEANVHGCAEATFVALRHAFGLPDPDDASAAMALNGGIAYSGGTCGAITGAALAIGMLAEHRAVDRASAKATARELVAGLLDAFREAYGATDCRALTGYDLRAPGQHDAFIAEGRWRETCMAQIELVVRRLAPLGEPAGWPKEAAGEGSGEA